MLSRLHDRATRRVRRHGDDAGITLTELLVSMTLMSIVGALALTMLVSTTDTTDRTTDSGVTTASARNAMSAWTDLLQVAVVPDADPNVRNLTISPTTIAFNAQLENLPACADSAAACTSGATTRVTLSLATTTVAGDLQSRLVQTLGRPNGVDTVTQVPSGAALLPAPSGQPACLFRPYRADGTAVDCTDLGNADTTGIARIDIAFRVTGRTGAAQTFTSTAKLPGSYA